MMKYTLLLLFVCVAFADTLDQSGIDAVVAAHNSARLDAYPEPEVPLTELTYSTSIEGTASSYANGCVWEHSEGTGFGENLYATSGNQLADLAALMTQASASWESEEEDYTLTADNDSCSNVCGHYTQMVWDDTTELGCGVAACSTGSPFGSSFPDWTFVVCNYNPPGNFIGELPYVISDGCDVAAKCAENSFECGDAPICEGSFNCGTCEAGFECNNNVCEQLSGACASCSAFTTCINDECVCLPGYVEVGGFCELADPDEPHTNGQFTQTLPTEGGTNFIELDGAVLELVQSGEHYLRWDRSSAFFDIGGTIITAKVSQTDGSFGIGAFHGQPENENDMFKWVISNISNGIAGLQICIGRFGFDFCSDLAPIDFAAGEHIITVTFTQIVDEIETTFQIDNTYTWVSRTDKDYFDNVGSVAYYFDPEFDTPTISEVTLATEGDFQVDLFGCLDDAEWTEVYNEYYGSGPAPPRVNGQNGCCDCAVDVD